MEILIALMHCFVWQGIFNDQGDYTVFLRGLKIVRPSSGPSSSLQKSAVENSVLDNGQAWIQQALLNHCLSSYVTMLVNNRQHLHACYDGELLCNVLLECDTEIISWLQSNHSIIQVSQLTSDFFLVLIYSNIHIFDYVDSWLSRE